MRILSFILVNFRGIGANKSFFEISVICYTFRIIMTIVLVFINSKNHRHA
jgi:hypothetical protein